MLGQLAILEAAVLDIPDLLVLQAAILDQLVPLQATQDHAVIPDQLVILDQLAATGYTGSIGYTGSVGYTGSASTASGFVGSAGYIGSVGSTGTTGFVGSYGYIGSTGIGYSGSLGYIGSAASNSVPASTSTTLSLTDNGKCVVASGTITVPNAVFSQGNVVSIYNVSTASIAIASGINTLRLAGTASTGTRTLAAYGLCTIWFNSGSEGIASGAGLS